MGFGISSPNLGFVDFLNPIQAFRGVHDGDVIKDTDPEPNIEIVKASEINKPYISNSATVSANA
jgi:hypothetical protein